MRREYLAGIGFVGVAVVLACIMYFYNPEQQQTNLAFDNHAPGGTPSADGAHLAGDAPERKLTSMNPKPAEQGGGANAGIKPVEPSGVATNLPSTTPPDTPAARPGESGTTPTGTPDAGGRQPIGSLLTHNPAPARPEVGAEGPLPPAPDAGAGATDPAKPEPSNTGPAKPDPVKPERTPVTPEPRRGGEPLRLSGGSNAPRETPPSDRSGERAPIREPGTTNVPTANSGTAPIKHIVARNETLVSLSERYYGDKDQWQRIVTANKGLNPKKLYIGKTIIIPPKEDGSRIPDGTSTPPATTPERTNPAAPAGRPAEPTTRTEARDSYKVKSNDTLVKIARAQLGDGERWREIYQLNRDKLKDPNRVVEGMVLKMPAKTTATAARTTP